MLIGKFFPEIRDKLLNTIQLCHISSADNSLILASIEKRTEEITPFEFNSSIDLKSNKKYVKFIAYPSLILLLLFLLVPQYLTESTKRIVNYDKEFTPGLLFTLTPTNENFKAFKNEDFVLEVEMKGSALPDQVYVSARGRKAKMKRKANNRLEYIFPKVQDRFTFRIEAANYESSTYEVEVFQRPDIKAFNISYLDFPNYTGKRNEALENVGNLTVPEGTQIAWTIQTVETESIQISFGLENTPSHLQQTGNQLFESKKRVNKSDSYSLHLQNQHSVNKDSIAYQIEVIKDQFPKISVDAYQDTLYSRLLCSTV